MASLLAILTQERDTLRAEESGIVARLEAENRRPTEAEASRLAEIDARFEGTADEPGLTAQIALAERRRERELSATAIRQVSEEFEERAEAAATVTLPAPFTGSLALGEQLVAVARASVRGGPMDPRLMAIQSGVRAAAEGLSERVDSDGGFLVQHDTTSELLREAYETGQVVSRTRQRPVTGSGLKIRAVDETSRADGSRMGGLQAYWTGEADDMTATKPKFRVIDLDLDKLTGVYYATDELLEDASALQAEVSGWFAEEFGFKFDDAVIRGTGAGQPLGILNAGALISVAKEGSQAADTVVAANLQKMFARMRPRSLARAAWFINQEVWPQLFGIEDTEGHRIYLPGGRLNETPFGTLLGLPIFPIEQASALGDVGDVILADLNQYLWIKRGGIQAATSIHVEFLSGQTAFRFVVRANGQPIPASATTPYKGASTLSPFVTLAERA